MKKIMLFPYNKDSVTLLNNFKGNKEYEIDVLCSFKEDIVAMEKEFESKRILLTNDFEKYAKEVDIVVFCENVSKVDPLAYLKKIEYLCLINKEFFLSNSLYNEIKLRCVDNFQKDLLDRAVIIENPYDEELKEKRRTLYPINTPIVCIMGFGENCNKFQTHLELYEKFFDKGYKCFNIFSNYLGKITGGEIYPNFFLKKNMSLFTKIQKFNMYIRDIEIKEKPDVIILSVPYGIMPANMFISNNFGEFAYIVSSSLQVDVGILCIDFFSTLNEVYCDELRKMLRYKFSVPLDVICVSDIKKRFIREENSYINYFLNRNSDVSCEFDNCDGIEIFSNLDENYEIKNRCLNSVISKLEKNIKVF